MNIPFKQALLRTRARAGQAMVEYALILALIAIAFGVTLYATGPVLANVFENVVNQVVGVEQSDLVALSDFGDSPSFWQTVQFINANPQLETPYPTPVETVPTLVPSPYTPATSTPTYTPSQTFTHTPSNTFTLTPTNTSTITPGPSPTPDDKVVNVPYYNRADNFQLNDWRLDRAAVLTVAPWSRDEYVGVTDFSGVPLTGTINQINEVFSGARSIRYQLAVNPATAATYNFITVLVDNDIAVKLDGTTVLSCSGSCSANVLIPSGPHTITVEYISYGGPGSINFRYERTNANPDDSGVTNGCDWNGRSNLPGGSTDAASEAGVFDNDVTDDAFPAGQTCYLEFRGGVNRSASPNTRLSFWDIWDFTGAGSLTATLEIAPYIAGDRSVWTGPNKVTIPLHTGGGANYAWTRYDIDLSPYYAQIGSLFTFRFKITSPSTGTGVRWYIDDVQVLNEDTPTRTFTVGDQWDLNNRAQMDDFIFDADANRTAELAGAFPSPWRWNLTSQLVRSGTGWDDSPSASYAAHTEGIIAGQSRVHYLEFAYPIDIRASRIPAVPAIDYEGDTGTPLLTFWHAFQIDEDAKLEVQYTFDAKDSTPDNWTQVANEGLLLDFTGGDRDELSMREASVRLDNANISGINGAPVRLRFALIVNAAPDPSEGEGWYIDDIRIEREDTAQFVNYEFIDTAEDINFTNDNWVLTGSWGRSTLAGSYNTGSSAYTDSPSTNSTPSSDTWMEMRRTLDLLNDTTANTVESPTRPAAVEPFLSFWWRGEIEASSVAVELYIDSTDTWYSVPANRWNWNQVSNRTQNAWERVEIDVKQALATATGSATWFNDAIASADETDDDIRVRLRLLTAATTASGIFVDDIRLAEKVEVVHELWPAGDGDLNDSAEAFTSPALTAANWDTWQERWFAGGTFGVTTNQPRNGGLTFADSPIGTYQNSSDYYFEFAPIIDLTGAAGTQPALSFFTRYRLYSTSAGDSVAIQVAVENTSDTTQGYNVSSKSADLAGWNTWTTLPYGNLSTTLSLGADRVGTWIRGRVDLSSYIGSRIRVRFVLTSNTTFNEEGIYLDDINFTSGHTILTYPFTTTNFDDVTNWVAEGNWGLTYDFVDPDVDINTDIGGQPWKGILYDCMIASCTPADYQTMVSVYDDVVSDYDSGTFTADVVKFAPESPNLSLVLGEVTLPTAGADADFNDSWAGRWRRDVTFVNGATYRIYTISDDGVRLRVNDHNGFTPASAIPSDGMLINNWTVHTETLNYRTFSVPVGTDLPRTLILDYFENTAAATIVVNIAREDITGSAYSDSPNTVPSIGGNVYTINNSTAYGYSALTLDGVIDLSAQPQAELSFLRYWDLAANANFNIDFSNDGGLNWTAVDTLTTPLTYRPPANTWDAVDICIPAIYRTPLFTFRIRLDTRPSDVAVPADGVWVENLSVNTDSSC